MEGSLGEADALQPQRVGVVERARQEAAHGGEGRPPVLAHELKAKQGEWASLRYHHYQYNLRHVHHHHHHHPDPHPPPAPVSPVTCRPRM
jgi:hypothetical protein